MTKTLSDEDLEAIRERAEKATAGPWDVLSASLVRAVRGDLAVPLFRSEAPIEWYKRKNLTHKALLSAYADEMNNAVFIAHAREDIPALLQHISDLKEQNERVREEERERCAKIAADYCWEDEPATLGFTYMNPDTGYEWAADHPRRSGECPDARDVRGETLREFMRDHTGHAIAASLRNQKEETGNG